jgi:glycosyltransferase involved in cell wall biosynthesis
MDFSKFDRPGDPVTRRIYDNGKTTILFVGRLIPNKKYEDLIKTFFFYKKYFNPNSQLILAGDYRGLERYSAALEELAGKLGLTDVHFTGHIDFEELVAFYRLADVYLSLSEHEGFGVPLLEAFYLKIPVVAFAEAAVEDTMNGGGILLRRKDFFKTAALLDMLIQDAPFRKKVVDSQLKALDKYQRENVSRILLGHVDRVSRG